MSVNTLQEQNKALETQMGFLKQSFEQQKLQQQQNLQQQNIQQQNLQQQNLQQQNLQQQNLQQNQQQQQNQPHPVVDANPVSNLKNLANQAIGNLPNAANQLAGNIKEAANSLGGGQVGDFMKNLGEQAQKLMEKHENVEEMEQNKLQQQKDKEIEKEAKNKLIEEHQQQHQVAPPNKHENDDDKLDHKLQLQPGKTSKETPKPVSHRPNINPPIFKRDGEKSEEKPEVPKVNDRISDKDSVNHNQMRPPGGLLDILKQDKIYGKNDDKLASNNDNKGKLHPEELNQQQNIAPPNIGGGVKTEKQPIVGGDVQQQNIPPPNVGGGVHEKQPVAGGNLQQINIPPPNKMIEPKKNVVDVPKLFDDSKEAAQFDTDLEKYKKEKAVQREQIKNDHDNRIQNQGPVGLQVQEPVIPKQVLFKDDNKKLDNNPNVDAQEDQKDNNAEEVNDDGHGNQVEDARDVKYYDEDDNDDAKGNKEDKNHINQDLKNNDFER
ncbi:unnamed protein product [Mytilus edulis]|uniref:Uncharacterized protein n=1 Tax=Mytilus edulis TaxID=6550 RepID=A0A8S3Q7S3_MYTED|nr:unnamed protein product [Mytilus edulis]